MATVYPVPDPRLNLQPYATEESFDNEQEILRLLGRGGGVQQVPQQAPAAAPQAAVQRALPRTVESLSGRGGDLFARGMALVNQEPDTSALQEYARQRGEMGNAAMMNALAAQFAGEGFAPMQAQFLKKAAAAQDPMKLAGGILTAEGKFLKDPFAEQDKKANMMLQLARHYEQMAVTAQTAQERAAALRAQQDIQNQLRLMGLQIQQQSLDLRSKEKNLGQRLPFSAVEQLAKQQGGADTMRTISDTFKDSYAAGAVGIPGVGSAQNWVGRNIPVEGNLKEQANWWQNYNEQANRIRNELFGSALTLTEKAAFEAAMINPDMDAKMIKLRLQQQADAARRAYDRLVDAAESSGYNVSGFKADRPADSGPKPGQVQPAQGGLTDSEQAELDALRKKYGR